MLYIQTCIIGLAILLIPLLNLRRGFGRDYQLFRAVIIGVMLDLIFETASWLLNGRFFAGSAELIYAVNLVTILLQSVMGLLWLYYTLEKLNIKLPERSPLHLLCAAPLIINAMLLFTNHLTRFIFVINEQHLFERGGHFWIDVVVSFIYPLAATALSLSVAAGTKNSNLKRECRVLAFFLIPPVVAAILQLIFYGTFLFLIGFAFALLVVFVNIQNEQITIDFLTRVNNRASFIDYFERKIRSVKPGHELYLFMIDVDSFKRINDTYGHTVGDQVLVSVAERLKAACSGRNCFLARLGGDEFSILFECAGAEDAREFTQSIHASLDEFNSAGSLSFPVTLSVGYAPCDCAEGSIDSIILRADAEMYSEKARHHSPGARSQ